MFTESVLECFLAVAVTTWAWQISWGIYLYRNFTSTFHFAFSTRKRSG